MARQADISLRDLEANVTAAVHRAERGERLRVVVDDTAVAELGPVAGVSHWVDGEVMEARIRANQADPALRRDLADLRLDTPADS